MPEPVDLLDAPIDDDRLDDLFDSVSDEEAAEEDTRTRAWLASPAGRAAEAQVAQAVADLESWLTTDEGRASTERGRARAVRNDARAMREHVSRAEHHEREAEAWARSSASLFTESPNDPLVREYQEIAAEQAAYASREWLEAKHRARRAGLPEPLTAEERRIAEAAEVEAAREALALEKKVAEQIQRLDAMEEAKRRIAARKAEAVEIAPALGLVTFLAQPSEGEAFAVDRVWPFGGNVAFAAQRKAGKTRVVHNLVRSLADAAPFLDEFETPTSRRVALLDFELPQAMLQHWLAEQGIATPGNVVLVESMKGRSGTFNILDDRVRSLWARKLADVGAEVLALDPLRPILRALKLNEWNEVGIVLDAFDALKVEAGIREGIIAHHHGHHAERAAGDSSFDGWGDAIWNLTRDDPNDPRSFRFFDAYGRGVDIDKGLVSLYDEGRLAFAAGSVQEARKGRAVDALATHVAENPGCRLPDLEAAGIRGVSKNTASRIAADAERAGLIRIEVGARGAKTFYPTTPRVE